MCGTIKNTHESKLVRTLMDIVGLGDVLKKDALPMGNYGPHSIIKNMIIEENGELKAVDAKWWYSCEPVNGALKGIQNKTTFNAHDLKRPTWVEPIKCRRGVIFADAIGESDTNSKGKQRKYLMEAKSGLMLGTLYKKWPGNMYSCAVITRDPHPVFSQYHKVSIPMFLPHDANFIKLWLDSKIEKHPEIDSILSNPRIYSDFTVTHVKTFIRSEHLNPSELMEKDAA